MTKLFKHSAACATGVISLACSASADVRLPALVSDNMVLLQGGGANVWGWADPGEKVTVTLGAQSAETVTGPGGQWRVKLAGLPAGPAGEMSIVGQNQINIRNVAVGEVWVASGQSNMALPLVRAMNADAEIAAAKYPEIRIFTVKPAGAAEPQKDCAGKWEICTPQNARRFPATAYFFARHLHQTLGLPIGVINASVAASPAEYWTPADVLAADPENRGFLSGWEQMKKKREKAWAAYQVELDQWKELSARLAPGAKPTASPPPRGAGGDVGAPGCYFQGMIAPLLSYSIRGVIWYQGEANASHPQSYAKLFAGLIGSWRQRWGMGDFPFLFVQVANFAFGPPDEKGSHLAELREAQLKALSLPKTGMAVAIDLGAPDTLYPKNKQEIGRRLALNALALAYHRAVEYSGPLFAGAELEEGKLRISFRFGRGLKTSDGSPPKGFVIAGADHRFAPAQVKIQGDHIVLQSPKVPAPVAARYAWADNPLCNLVNAAGLPASPFRTDDWDQ